MRHGKTAVSSHHIAIWMWALAVSICVEVCGNTCEKMLVSICVEVCGNTCEKMFIPLSPASFFGSMNLLYFICYMNMNDDEAIGLINRLLERLHQADLTNFGSHLQIVYVASGAQHVENQINMGEKTLHKSETLPSPSCVGRKKAMGDLPEVLATDEALTLWKKAQAAGGVDANYQPLISRTQAALLADAMAERLGIREKWKVYMRSDYNLALTRKVSLDFQNELKRLLG